MKSIGFSLSWPRDPRQGQGHWKWYEFNEMVEVNGAYKQVQKQNLWRYEKVCM